jgi:hypothetical protein
MTDTWNGRSTATPIPRREQRCTASTGTAQRNAQPATAYASRTVIPWSDIWTSLNLAKGRGNGLMISAFYDMLFRDAVFDDRGAWSLNIPRPK